MVAAGPKSSCFLQKHLLGAAVYRPLQEKPRMAVALYGSSGFCHYFFLISKDTFFLPQASAERLPLWHSSYKHLLLSAHVFLVNLSSHFIEIFHTLRLFFQGILNCVSFSTFSGAIYIYISKIFY